MHSIGFLPGLLFLHIILLGYQAFGLEYLTSIYLCSPGVELCLPSWLLRLRLYI